MNENELIMGLNIIRLFLALLGLEDRRIMNFDAAQFTRVERSMRTPVIWDGQEVRIHELSEPFLILMG